MKCVVYARVSTKREEQKNSLQNQIALAETISKEQTCREATRGTRYLIR